ncbi:MAG: LamG domain-containing protein, partial [Phycisphaerales bacterium]
MRLRISQGVKRMSAVCVTALLLTSGAARAATIGYWSFDDAAPGTNAGTLVTQTNSPDIDGTAGTYDDQRTQYPGTPVLPIHHASRPGGGIQVTSGVGGAVVNSENTASLKFANPQASGFSPDAGIVTVQDPGASTLLEPAGDFTIEGFVRLNNATILWASLVGKDRSGLVSWGINTSSTGNALSVRIDSLNGSVGQTNQGITALNFNIADGQWHHFAMTYTASERKIRLYGDYNQLALNGAGDGVIANNGVILYDDSALYFGGRAGSGGLDGNLDEVRYSDTALTPDQFLRVVPSPAHPSYQPDGSIKSTHTTMTMSDSGVIDMVDDAGNTHGIHLSMVYRATGAWFTAAHTLSKVKTVNAQTRTTTFTGIIQPPTGSIDLTPIPFRFWMQLKDDDKVHLGVEYDTPLPILEILSSVEMKDHVRPRTSFEGYYIRADGTTYLISATDPAGMRTLTLGPIQTAVLFDDVPEHRIQFLKVESGAESLRDYNTAPTPYEEVRYTLTSGMANRLRCEMVLPDEPSTLIPASPVFQPDGRIVSGGTSLAISSGMFNLVDTNAITYGIHLSMAFKANGAWFTAGTTGAVTDPLTTVDTVAKQVTFTGLINPPAGSLDMTLIPLSYWMQLQTNGTIRIQADFTRSGSIFDILSLCNLNSHSRPRAAYSGHIIQADGDSFPIANDPPGTYATVLKSGTIQQTRFMSDSPLQTITMSKVTSTYQTLRDYNITSTAPYIEMQYKTDDATNTVAMDVTFPPTDTNPSSETYGGVDFWKSDNLRMPPFGKSANLVSNPSFEHDLQYWRWNTFSGTITDSLADRYYVIDSTTAYHGNRSLKLIGKQGQTIAQLATFAI